MATKNKPVFRVQFRQGDQLVELYAHGVSQSSMMAFVEVSDLIFDHRTNMLIDPAEEKLKTMFGDVKSTYIPVHMIVRIDEVKKTGSSKIRPLRDGEMADPAITPFPTPSAPGKN